MCRGEEMNSWADVSVCFLLVNFLQQDLILYFLKNFVVKQSGFFVSFSLIDLTTKKQASYVSRPSAEKNRSKLSLK